MLAILAASSLVHGTSQVKFFPLEDLIPTQCCLAAPRLQHLYLLARFLLCLGPVYPAACSAAPLGYQRGTLTHHVQSQSYVSPSPNLIFLQPSQPLASSSFFPRQMPKSHPQEYFSLFLYISHQVLLIPPLEYFLNLPTSLHLLGHHSRPVCP